MRTSECQKCHGDEYLQPCDYCGAERRIPPGHGVLLACPCCMDAAEMVREAEAESRAAHERLGDALTDYRDAHEERKRLREALDAAASSLETLSRTGMWNESEMMVMDLIDVRDYAANRAKVARKALEDTDE